MARDLKWFVTQYLLVEWSILPYIFANLFADSNAYAHFVFNAFDKDKNGSISFEVIIGCTIRKSYNPLGI